MDIAQKCRPEQLGTGACAWDVSNSHKHAVCEAPLSERQVVQIINYHATTSSVARHDVHSIEDAAFDRHLDLIAASGVKVLHAAHLTRPCAASSPLATAFTFDDGYDSDLRNATKLAARGWNGIFFLSTHMLGQPGFLDRQGIQDLQQLGMIIGSHSHQHVRLTTLPKRLAADELKRSKDILEDVLCQPVAHFAFPGGAYDEGLLDLVSQTGYTHVFGTDWGPVKTGTPSETGVYRRNNILQHMSDAHVLDLVTLRNRHARSVIFNGKKLLNRCLPDALYREVRDRFVSAT